MYLLARLEETPFSSWIRETGWVFFGSLTLHSLALALVVGFGLLTTLRLMGWGPELPVNRLRGFLPVVWSGLAAVLLSGALLLLAYPAKALTNPLFYVKLTAILAALTLTLRLLNKAELLHQTRTLAGLTFLLWIVSVAAGRFLAYTHTVLLASSFY
jgi:hypothetical protein